MTEEVETRYLAQKKTQHTTCDNHMTSSRCNRRDPFQTVFLHVSAISVLHTVPSAVVASVASVCTAPTDAGLMRFSLEPCFSRFSMIFFNYLGPYYISDLSDFRRAAEQIPLWMVGMKV